MDWLFKFLIYTKSFLDFQKIPEVPELEGFLALVIDNEGPISEIRKP